MAKKLKKATRKTLSERVTVRGMNYRLTPEEISQIEERIEDDEPIPCTLEREPTNEVDPLAIKVIALDPVKKMFNNRHIGYIQRPTNEALGKLLKKGARITTCLLDFVEPEHGDGELELTITLPREP